MVFKTRYLLLIIFLFLIVIFLDQNNIPVPVKMIVGQPFYVQLSIIIIISMVTGMFLILMGSQLLKKILTKKAKTEE